jgi:hypothetical protein
MSDEPARRSGRFGGIFVAVVVAGSGVGVLGWYFLTNRAGPSIATGGFDVSAVEQVRRPAATASPTAPAPESSLGMMKSDPGIRIGGSNPASGQARGSSEPSPESKTGNKVEDAHAGLKDAARKHEVEVRNFAVKMTKKYPLIRQYGKDWMSYPDLKKLNDDYSRNHDPIAFIQGLAKSPNLGAMVQKYGASPEIREFIVEGMKEAPADLTGAAIDALQSDGALKNIVANVAGGLGLPPSITGLISGSGDPSKLDQKQVMGDMMKDPNLQKAMQGQQPPAVPLNQ